MNDPLSLDALSALDAHLSDDERMVQQTVRRFIRERYLPKAGEMYEKEIFPSELIEPMAELGLLGASLQGYGCAGMSAVQYGLMLQELEYGDSGLRSFASVQGSLAMYPIHAYGSEAQKERLLPGMAQGKLIGCFGLTEPDSGSDPSSMKTRARRDGSDWVLSGTKMWITNSPFADVAVVWAKTEGDDPKGIQGFIVERGMKGFETPRIHGKMSLRSSETGEIVLDECRVPDENRLPGVRGLRGPLSCLTQARFGIAWGAMGAAKACFDATVDYTRSRVQFGVPIASKQLVQEHLADMATEIVKGDLLTLHYSRMKDRSGITPVQVSLCKRNNVGQALAIARRCRGLLGGNGILLEYPVIRHMLNLESVYTYEGTHEIHTLVLGQALTGHSAF
jgi:glutaryl-CoA dehydrogenase